MTLLKILVLCAAILLTGSQIFASHWEWGLKTGIVRSRAGFSHDLPYITLAPIDEFALGSYFSFFFIKNFETNIRMIGKNIKPAMFKDSYIIKIPVGILYFRFSIKPTGLITEIDSKI